VGIAYDDRVLRITLDRPEVLNAMTETMADRVSAEIEHAHAREDVRAVLLEGNAVAFSAGVDLGATDGHENLDATTLARANRIIRAITSSPLPCVASVRGAAAGVGCSAAHACDLVPDEDHEAAVERLLRRLAAGPPLAHTATKRAVNAATLHQLEPALERESTGQVVLLRTADAAEGIRAFTEKRRPEFRGE